VTRPWLEIADELRDAVDRGERTIEDAAQELHEHALARGMRITLAGCRGDVDPDQPGRMRYPSEMARAQEPPEAPLEEEPGVGPW
jgi:hypothetical protein